jgi:hypothetical protein
LCARAASSGDIRAIFALAETYDPYVLSAWRVRGIKGDRNRANALYEDALAKGENRSTVAHNRFALTGSSARGARKRNDGLREAARPAQASDELPRSRHT